MSILREIFVKLGLDVDAQAFAKGNIAAEVLKASFEKVVDVAKETAQAFIENIEATAEYGDKIIELGAATGIGTKSLQQLGKAAAEEGIGIDEFGHSIILLSKQMSAAKEGSDEVKKAFKAAGAQFTDGAGKLRPAEDVFVDISEGFHKMKDGAEKTALSMKLFGKSGASMIDFLNRGKDDLAEYFNASVMNEEQLKAGKEVVEIQRALTAQTRSLWKSAVAPLLPAIRDLLKLYLDWKKANNDVMKSNLTKVMQAGIAVVKALGNGFIFLTSSVQFFKDNWKTVVGLIVVSTGYLTLANIGLAASYGLVGAKAIWAGTVATAAWIKAAAPFIAIGAIIAGVLLVFDDLRRYQWAMEHGGKGAEHTFFGRLNALVDDWGKKKIGEPWWMTGLRETRDILKELIDLIKIWNESTNGEFIFGSRAQTMNPINALSPEAKARVQRMQEREQLEHPAAPAPWYERGARWGMNKLLGPPPSQQGPNYNDPSSPYYQPLYASQQPGSGPMYTPAPGAAPMVNRNVVTIPLTFPPGADKQMVKDAVSEVLVEQGVVTSSDVEAATASASYTPAGG